MNPHIRVLLVNGHDPALMAWPPHLPEADDIVVVGHLGLGPVAETDAAALHPDVILLDGEALKETGIHLLTQYPTLLLCRREDELSNLPALQGGAAGVLISDETTPEALVEAIRAVRRGEAILSPRLTGQILDALTHEPAPYGAGFTKGDS